MGSRTIILAGQTFSKAEIISLFNQVADFAPDRVQEDARYIREYLDNSTCSEIERTLFRLSKNSFIQRAYDHATAPDWEITITCRPKTPDEVDSSRAELILAIRTAMDDRGPRMKGDLGNSKRAKVVAFDEIGLGEW